MISRRLSFIMIIGLGMLLVTGNTQAQPLTPLDACIAGFYDALDVWENDAEPRDSGGCQVEQGKAWDNLRGFYPGTAYYLNFNAKLRRDGGVKSCTVGVSRHPDATQTTTNDPYYTFELTGKEASEWNKFLKGEGCLEVLSYLP